MPLLVQLLLQAEHQLAVLGVHRAQRAEFDGNG
jgi:hypothetical protein